MDQLVDPSVGQPALLFGPAVMQGTRTEDGPRHSGPSYAAVLLRH